MKRALFLLPLLTLLPLLGRAATYYQCPKLEAESATLSGMTTLNNASYSNGQAEQVNNANSGSITFSFTPVITGNYIFGVGIVSTNSSRWMNVGINGKNDTLGVGTSLWKASTANDTEVYLFNTGGGNTSGTTSQSSARIWNLTGGTPYSIKLSGVDAGVIVDYLQPWLDASYLNPNPVSPSGTGLCATYWNWSGGAPPVDPGSGTNWTGNQGPINWGALSASWPPNPPINQTQFEVEWDGYVMPQYTDTYTFTTVSDDGVKLWVNNNLVINDWGDHGSTTDNSSGIALTANNKVPVKLQYYQDGGGAVISLAWWAPGGEFNSLPSSPQIIPLNQLYACAAGAGTPTRTYTASPTPTQTPTPTPGAGSVVPILTSLSPTTGASNTFPTGVTLTGANFVNPSTVSFGGSPGTSVTWISSTQVWCIAPYHTAGTYTVTVSNANGTSNGLPFTYINPIWQGLTPDTRLYGLEYIPFPVQSSGANNFYDLSMSFSSAALNDVPKNTARWKIVLKNLNGISNNNCTNCIQFETRVGPDGVTCTSGYYDAGTIGNATSLALPSKPQNISIDYTWLSNASVPVTQAFDAVGDPRYVPYLDLMGQSGSPFANNYNWFFRNLSTDSSGAAYTAFLPDAIFNSYSGGQGNVDVPKLYRLIREGMMLTTSVYTAVNGWSNYYFGIGGEIGGDSSNDLPSPGVVCDGGPWNQSGTYNVDEIIGSATNGASWVRATNGWYSRPFIGELWPDSLYQSDWSGHAANASWGNLKNSKNSGIAYRDAITNFDQTYAVTYTAGGIAYTGTYGGGTGNTYNFGVIYHRDSAEGCATMMNGTDGSSSNTFNHNSPAYTANLLYDGTIINNDFNFPMPTTFAVSRPWQLNLGGNQPDEWSMAPYNGRRTTLAVYSASQAQPTSSWGFYDWTNGAEARTSAAVRMVDLNSVVNPSKPSAAFYVINGLAPSGTSGINFVARFALLTCIRTFLDAGAPTGYPPEGFTNPENQVGAGGPVFRIAPIPLVQITSPTNHQDRSHIDPLTIDWKERYARWDNYRYTENYPCIDGPAGSPCPGIDGGNGDPSVEWHDGTSLFFNVIYSADDAHWYSAPTNTPAIPGEPVGTPTGPDTITFSITHLYSYSWNINNVPTALQTGNKWVRVECFRQDANNNPMQHYSFHEIQVITAP